MTYVTVAGAPFASATASVIEKSPAGPRGTPTIRPSRLSDKPGGRIPSISVYEYGATPPLVVTVALYGTFATAFGSAVGATVSVGQLITSVTTPAPACLFASVPETVNL